MNRRAAVNRLRECIVFLEEQVCRKQEFPTSAPLELDFDDAQEIIYWLRKAIEEQEADDE